MDADPEENPVSPLRYFIAPILIILLIATIIPYYAIRLDPEPTGIPAPAAVLPSEIKILQGGQAIFTPEEFSELIRPSDPVIKQTADKVSTASCEGNRICQAKALYYFVRDNFDYVSDPPNEYVKSAGETLASGGGDCDDFAVLLANLEQAIGIRTRFVFKPGHVYIQIYLPEALKKYRKGDWVNLDPTCRSCSFGELPMH
ncbi:MAG: transglutaminase-like domain-containing protein [archaeon]